MFRLGSTLLTLLAGIIIGVLGTFLVIQSLPGMKTETRAVTIKATEVKSVDQTVVVQTTTEIDQESIKKFGLPGLGDIPIVTRTARGNGSCAVGTDNQTFQPYFLNSDRQKKEELAPNEKNATIVVGPPQVLLCGITSLTFRDGSGLPLSTTPIFNGLVDEAIHRTVCEGNADTVLNKAKQDLAERFAEFYRKAGLQLRGVQFGDNEQPQAQGDPRFKPQRTCAPVPISR